MPVLGAFGSAADAGENPGSERRFLQPCESRDRMRENTQGARIESTALGLRIRYRIRHANTAGEHLQCRTGPNNGIAHSDRPVKQIHFFVSLR